MSGYQIARAQRIDANSKPVTPQEMDARLKREIELAIEHGSRSDIRDAMKVHDRFLAKHPELRVGAHR